MAVYSMTGYASAQHRTAPTTPDSGATDARAGLLGMEIRSVNGRFLDLSFKLPEELRASEPALRELLGAQLRRGKVEVRVSIESASSSIVPEPSAWLLQRVRAVQEQVHACLPEARSLGVADVLRIAATSTHSDTDWSTALLALAAQALQALREARAREGARLATMLLQHLAALRQLAAQAAPLVPRVVEQQRLRFMERWKEALALGEGTTAPDAAHERALTEATAFAIRIDIAEELTRLQSHLEEIERLVRQGGDVGKRLDFLIQELQREANTLGSKSAVLELTRIAVDMKVLIEQMREQVQNIE